ncbi:MAG: DNA cytosine methyltransferase [Hallerella succinigenes]|nr:DNA cytosine methyltransferase [Hallerella succinigenes]MDY5029322.1 DNA cytosine methyltransferase [Hallerella succinigenes]
MKLVQNGLKAKDLASIPYVQPKKMKSYWHQKSNPTFSQEIKKVNFPIMKKNFSLADLSSIKPLVDGFKLNGKTVSFDDQLAILTHAGQSQKSDLTVPYQETAQKIFDLWKSKLSTGHDRLQVKDSSPLYLFPELFEPIFKAQPKTKFTFIDLFAGIGGFRLAMQSCGGRCVFSSEWDDNAKKTYLNNFGELPFGDITLESTKACIPDGFDVLCGGFPCQAFSIAGYRKGFEDTRGTLFFDVAEIIKRKRPKAVYLENVKNLYTHDNGKTFEVIKNTLEELGYVVYHKVMNAMEYANVPQNRERIFIVCFDPKQVPNHANFKFPVPVKLTKTIHDCIKDDEDSKELFYSDKMGHFKDLQEAITSKDSIYQWRRQYVRENKSHVCPTLTANMGTGGHNVPLILTDAGIRKLSPKECINFQGYPVKYEFPKGMSNAAKYKQAGNSVVVPLITRVSQNIISVISGG